jgi:IS605 OrfB family transposase
MIRETRYTLKFSNIGKLNKLNQAFDLYKHDLQLYVNAILSGELPFNQLASKPNVVGGLITQSHWKQALYKDASAIVRSNLRYTKNRVFKRYQKRYAQCIESGRLQWFTCKHYKELHINYMKRIHITIKNVSIPLSQMVVNIEQGKHFDHFLEITLPIEHGKGGKTRYEHIKVPIKSYKYCNRYSDWKRRMTVKLVKNEHGMFACLAWEKDDTSKKMIGNIVGIDLGYNKLITTDQGQIYGDHLKPIYIKLANKVRGSKNYRQLLQHKKCEVNRVVNQFVKEQNLHTLYCEDLKELRKSSKLASRELNKQQYFTYAQVLTKLERTAEVEGFQLIRVNPAYTSQTCSKCGEIHKESRLGETFKCISCNMVMDADVNASINILRRGAFSPSGPEE